MQRGVMSAPREDVVLNDCAGDEATSAVCQNHEIPGDPESRHGRNCEQQTDDAGNDLDAAYMVCHALLESLACARESLVALHEERADEHPGRTSQEVQQIERHAPSGLELCGAT